MKVKKRNLVLEILICTALAVLVLLVYMGWTKRDSGMEIRDIAGDRAYLAEFSFEGIAGEASGYQHFRWEDGTLKTRYYPVDGWDMDTILTGEKEGKTGFRKYFGSYDSGSFRQDTEVFPVPAKGAEKRNISSIEELTEENRAALEKKCNDWYGGIPYGSTMSGFTTDQIMLYAEVTDYENKKCARFFTGLTCRGGEYYFTEWTDADGSGLFNEASAQDFALALVDTEDAYYTILKTTESCKGEVFLQRIPKEEMADGWSSNLLWDKAVRGKAEVLRSFSVDAKNRIIGLTAIGEDRLLLARSEEDTLLLELYDTEGNFITQLKTDVEQVSGYDLRSVYIHDMGEHTLLWFELPRRVYREGTNAEDFHYEVDGARYYVCDQESIAELNVEGDPEYMDYADGKVLLMEYNASSGKREENELIGFYLLGYKLKVIDGITGELLYEGALETDFRQDYYRTLSVLNIGKEAGYVSERKDAWDQWNGEESQNTEIRKFWRILPVYGKLGATDWSEGVSYGYERFRYYG